MILNLIDLRHAEQSTERREDYRYAIDLLDALVYRLETAAAPGRVVGLPKTAIRAAGHPAQQNPPQPLLPLVPVIVRGRKPRR